VARYRFVLEEFGPPAEMLVVGGIPAMFAIHELQRSYIDGNYLATILTAQVFVGHSLGGMFSLAGEVKVVESGFSNLIEETRARNMVNNEVAERSHQLRKTLNPYSHPRVGIAPRSYMARPREHFKDPEQLAEDDARRAIRTIIDFLRGGSPNWVSPRP
jgi:hypothetical protein